MQTVSDASLYDNQEKRSQKIADDTRKFVAVYCGSIIIGENIFGMISNYAKLKRESGCATCCMECRVGRNRFIVRE